MTAGRSWSVFQVVLVASSLIVLFYVALFVIGLLLGFMISKSAPKTVEIVRYVSVANSASAQPARSPPSAPGM